MKTKENKLYHAKLGVLYKDAWFTLSQEMRLNPPRPVLVKRAVNKGRGLLESEFKFATFFPMDGFLAPIELIKKEREWELLFHHFGHRVKTLAQLQAATAYPISREHEILHLKIMMECCRALKEMHANHLIHRGLSPDSIFWDEQDLEVKIGNRHMAGTFPKYSHNLNDPAFHLSLETEHPYWAPEQSGERNDPLDPRTDLYSLGAIFYKGLVGAMPWNPSPLFPHQLNSKIPVALSRLFVKLLSPDPRDRYQSAEGLMHDLSRYLKVRVQDEKIEQASFPLGKKDRSEDELPSFAKSVGKDEERRHLWEDFLEVSRGETSHLVLLSGISGAGKSTLAGELLLRIASQKRGMIGVGKFSETDQSPSHPFSVLSRALSMVIGQMGHGPADEIAMWKQKLSSRLYPRGTILYDEDKIPELQDFMGPAVPLPELLPEEKLPRLQSLYVELLSVLTEGDRPLVLVLDDLQWADPEYFGLLSAFLTNPQLKNFYLLGIHRNSNDPGPVSLLKNISAKRVANGPLQTRTLYLGPLEKGDILLWLKEVFNSKKKGPPHFLPQLAGVLFDKTGGNPLHVHHMLEILRRKKWVFYEREAEEWRWDVKSINEFWPEASSASSLMQARINILAPSTLKTIQLASCLGRNFDLETLGLIAGKSGEEVARDLDKDVEDEFIVFEGGNYSFPHDGIHQATYESLSPEERNLSHLKIGRALLEQKREKEQDADYIFTLAHHLNQGSSLMERPEEKYQLAEIGLEAGKRAFASLAYRKARGILEKGVHLLSSKMLTPWKGMLFEMQLLQAHSEFHLGNFKKTAKLLDALIAQAPNRLEVCRPLTLKVNLLAVQAESSRDPTELKEGMTWALDFLGRLNSPPFPPIPLDPTDEQLADKILELKKMLGKRPMPHLLKERRVEDRLVEARMGILYILLRPSYHYSTNLYAYLCTHFLMLNHQYGHSEVSPFPMVQLFAAIGHRSEHFQLALLCAKASLHHGQKLDSNKLLHREIFLVYGMSAAVWTDSIDKAIDSTRLAFNQSWKAGSSFFPLYSGLYMTSMALAKGEDLSHVLKDLEKILAYSLRTPYAAVIQLLHLFHRKIKLLMDGPADKKQDSGVGSVKSMALSKRDLSMLNGTVLEFYYHVIQMQLHYFEDNIASAAAEEKKARKLLRTSYADIFTMEYYFYSALVLTRSYGRENQSTEALAEMKDIIQQRMHFLRLWSREGNSLFIPRYLLVVAEWERLFGKRTRAQEFYENALERSKEMGARALTATIHELAGEHFTALNLFHPAQGHLREAATYYSRWGAAYKSEQVIRKLPLVSKVESLPVTDQGATPLPSTSSLGGINFFMQNLSGETDKGQIFNKLMPSIMEHSGASRAFFIHPDREDVVIHWQAHRQEERSLVVGSGTQMRVIPELIPMKQVEWAIRNKEKAVLSGGRGIILPLYRTGQHLGTLYLEAPADVPPPSLEKGVILEFFTDLLALALEYANLSAEVKEGRKQLLALIGEGPGILAIEDKKRGVK